MIGLKLGCLNHARLSARAIEADGCRLAGWIGSCIEPDFDALSYRPLLDRALRVPCLGELPHAPGADPAAMGGHLAPA